MKVGTYLAEDVVLGAKDRLTLLVCGEKEPELPRGAVSREDVPQLFAEYGKSRGRIYADAD